jgi:AraC-like DNA-binding protein
LVLNELAVLIAAPPGTLLWPAAIVAWGEGGVSAAHRHHCVQLAVPLGNGASLRMREAPAAAWVDCRAAVVRPNALHEIDACGVPVLLAFVEPASRLGAALLARSGGAPLALIEPDAVPPWLVPIASAGFAIGDAAVRRWIEGLLLADGALPAQHAKVSAVLDHLRQNVVAWGDVSLQGLARTAGLSPSRLMHVFSQSMGVPLRPYILWLRLQRASAELLRGASVTQAAHEAGFADAAHLTRTLRRMFGTTPSELAQRSAGAAGVALGTGP